MNPERRELEFFSQPDAELTISLHGEAGRLPQIRLWGNRRGILSLANLVLWLWVGADSDELSLAELPFVSSTDGSSLILVVDDAIESANRVWRRQAGVYDWHLSDDMVRRVGLTIHNLAARPAHEYDAFVAGEELMFNTTAEVEIRMTDIDDYL